MNEAQKQSTFAALERCRRLAEESAFEKLEAELESLRAFVQEAHRQSFGYDKVTANDDPSCREYAQYHEGACCEETAEDFNWEPVEIPTAELLRYMSGGTLKDWSDWWQQELSMKPDYCRSMWVWMESGAAEIEDIVFTPDHIWDGWHRTACAILQGRPTMPAVRGIPRPKE